MKYSFILCTLNRKKMMLDAIDSLLKQSFSDFEIIVIDQSEETSQEIEKLDNRIKYYHSEKRGLSYNRNLGISLSNGEYICLMDDDATFDKNSLENINRALEKYTCDIVCGKILDPITKQISLHGMKNDSVDVTYSNIMEYCSSPSLTIKSHFAKKGFDEAFGVGSKWGCGEEVDLVLRSMYDGGRVKYDPSIIVYHPSVKKETITDGKAKAYSLGYGALCAKHYIMFKNKHMKMYFNKAILKHWIARFLYTIKKNPQLRNYYNLCLNNKVQGYREYKAYLAGRTEDDKNGQK